MAWKLRYAFRRAAVCLEIGFNWEAVTFSTRGNTDTEAVKHTLRVRVGFYQGGTDTDSQCCDSTKKLIKRTDTALRVIYDSR